MHFYELTQSGVEPRHYVPMVSRPEELRPTRLNDVKKMRKEGRTVVPSVTTVMNILAKPQLDNWKIDQHLFIADTCRMLDQEEWPTQDWIKEVKRLTELQLDIAPSKGSDLHKLMENFVLGEIPEDREQYLLCESVSFAIREKIDQPDLEGMKPEVNFVSDLGYGGQVDLSGNNWIIDYKTKQTKEKFKPGKMVYDDHRIQLAAYREGLNMPDARCANVFICLEDGSIDFHEHKEEELIKGWEMFTRCLELWQLMRIK